LPSARWITAELAATLKLVAGGTAGTHSLALNGAGT
jgi:hypothetical protein